MEWFEVRKSEENGGKWRESRAGHLKATGVVAENQTTDQPVKPNRIEPVKIQPTKTEPVKTKSSTHKQTQPNQSIKEPNQIH